MMEGAAVSVQDAGGKTVWTLARGPGAGMMGGGMEGMMGGTPTGTPRSLPVTVNGRVVGTALVRLPAAGTGSVDVAFRDAVNRLLLLTGLGAGLLAGLVGLVLARRATIPVRELTRTAGRLAAGERDERVRHHSGDEFGAMAEAFNSMADSIAEEDRLRRTFAADVAHELRTPLMILSSQLEALEDGVIELGPGAVRSLQEETRRITRLVSDLEVLASADAAHFSLESRRLDLAAEVEAVLAEFRPLFEERSVALAGDLEAAAVVGDAQRLRQVAGNLLSNALKFTPEGGRVEVSLRRQGTGAVLEVADSGPGIPAEELDRVFERFFRGQGARVGGSGIGLTVVRELVAAQGGRVRAANAPGGGAVFTVTLPLAAPAPAARGTRPRPRAAAG